MFANLELINCRARNAVHSSEYNKRLRASIVSKGVSEHHRTFLSVNWNSEDQSINRTHRAGSHRSLEAVTTGQRLATEDRRDLEILTVQYACFGIAAMLLSFTSIVSRLGS